METGLSRWKAQQILDRMDTIPERVPYAVKQARERTIGERQVANEEKILSLYEGHAVVYVRSKGGAESDWGAQSVSRDVRRGPVAPLRRLPHSLARP